MTFKEFKKFIENNPVEKILFRSEDQDWFDSFGVVPNFALEFNSIHCSIVAPRIIHIVKHYGHVMQFYGADDIAVEDGETPATKVFRIRNKAPLGDCQPNERTYTFIAEMCKATESVK